MNIDIERVRRLEHTIRKLAQWQGYDINDLIADGYLEEGDLS